MLEELLCYFDFNTVIECCLVSKAWYHEIMSLNKVWAVMCTRNRIIIRNQPSCSGEAPRGVRDAPFYQTKIRDMVRRRKEFNMKGYSFEEILGTSVLFIACNSSHIILIRESNEVVCVDNSTWKEECTRPLSHAQDVVFLQCSDEMVAVGYRQGYVTTFNLRKQLALEGEVHVDLTNIKCVKIEEKAVAMIRGPDLVVIESGNALLVVDDVGYFSWRSFQWDGDSPKDGIYENILQFFGKNKLIVISPKQVCVIEKSRLNSEYGVTSISHVNIVPGCTSCPVCRKCYFWPSILVSDRYICCRTSCSIRLYERQNNARQNNERQNNERQNNERQNNELNLVKVFPRSCSSNERLLSPSDRCNLLAAGSKFLVAVDSHCFPRILIFDIESCQLLSTLGDDISECDGQSNMFHGIYHTSYFVKIPSRHWLDGDFEQDTTPCLIAFKHQDFKSASALFIFHFESFKVRADS